MPRNISFAMTTPQFVARTKTVTRRIGWLHLRASDVLCGVKKGMGLKPGEKIERLGFIHVISVGREKLSRILEYPRYGIEEVAKEGFPDMTASEFISFFCDGHKGCRPGSLVTRIEFEYINGDVGSPK